MITTVRDQYLSSATFPTPLIFHYPLPLRHIFVRTAKLLNHIKGLRNLNKNHKQPVTLPFRCMSAKFLLALKLSDKRCRRPVQRSTVRYLGKCVLLKHLCYAKDYPYMLHSGTDSAHKKSTYFIFGLVRKYVVK